MDFYPDPPGTKTEHATHFFACLGGSSANIGVAIS
jgi:5-dehydro-2-deoxygluconokinase